jgi:hypothetical protein
MPALELASITRLFFPSLASLAFTPPPHKNIYTHTHQRQTLMSAMLHRENEQYDEDGVSWFNKLKGIFGEEQRIQ